MYCPFFDHGKFLLSRKICCIFFVRKCMEWGLV